MKNSRDLQYCDNCGTLVIRNGHILLGDDIYCSEKCLRAGRETIKTQIKAMKAVINQVASMLSCHCWRSGEDVDRGVHLPSCVIGKALELKNKELRL